MAVNVSGDSPRSFDEPRLYGRDRELTVLGTALDTVSEGAGAAFLINGPVGVGRSALLDWADVLARDRGLRVLRAQADVSERDFGFGVLRQLLGPALYEQPEEIREMIFAGVPAPVRAAVLGEVLTVAGPAAAAWWPRVHGLELAVSRLGRERPLAVLVDDLQAADELSLACLLKLARAVPRMPMFFLGAVRDDSPHAGQGLVAQLAEAAASVITLSPLGEDDARAMLRDWLGPDVADDTVQAYLRASGGNPLLLTSGLLDGLPEDAAPPGIDVVRRGLRWTRLRDRLAAHFTEHPAYVRECAVAMAVLGGLGGWEAAGQFADVDPAACGDAIRTLWQMGLLTGDGEYRLHPLAADGIIQTLTLAERDQSHARAASVLYASGHPTEAIAAHLLLVGRLAEPWAVATLRLAAEAAVARGALEAAASYLRRALRDAEPQTPERGRLLIDLAASELGADPAAALRHLHQALPLLPDLRDRAAAVTVVSPMLVQDGSERYTEVLRAASRETAAGAAVDSELATRIEARLSYADAVDPPGIARLVRRLDGLGTEPALDTQARRELVAVMLHRATMGARVSAREAADLAGRLLRHEPSLPSRLHGTVPLVIQTLISADEPAVAASWLDGAYALATQQAAEAEYVLVRTAQAAVALATGQLADARLFATDAFERAHPDWDEAYLICGAVLGNVAIAARDSELIRRSQAALSRRHTERIGITALHGRLHAAAMVLGGDDRAALRQVEQLGRQWDEAGQRNPLLFPGPVETSALHLRLGDRAAALEAGEEAYARAAAWGAPAGTGRALRVLAAATEGPRGIDLLDEAVRFLEASANRLELARTLVVLGRRLHESDPQRAADSLRRGHELARSCGAPDLAGDAATLLAELRIEPVAPPPRSLLTPAENRVAWIAAEGPTNQEIAATLGITSRAVEKHLTSVYRKLRLEGKRGLAEALGGAGQRPAVNG